MQYFITLVLLLPLYGKAQHYDRKPNLSRQIQHFEKQAYKLYASALIYGSPDKTGLCHPIYRVESFQNHLYKVVDLESGSVLNTYGAGGSVAYSRFAKYWATNQPESPGYNIISGVTANSPHIFHKSDIFHEGVLVQISELSGQFITLYSHNTLNCFSLEGNKNWTYGYPYGDLNAGDLFLSSDESLLIINIQGVRVLAIDMTTGREAWQFEGKYSATSLPFQLVPKTILYDQFYGEADIIDSMGRKRYHIENLRENQSDSYIYMRRLVNGNIIIPDLLDQERRVKLPSKLTSNNSEELISPITWSTEATYFTRMFTYQENLESSDSTVERYRVEIGSVTGSDMGYFYPRIRSKLDNSSIKVQISNEGTHILMIGKQKEGLQFVCREYEVSF